MIRLKRYQPKHRKERHEHTFEYTPPSVGGWGIARCTDPECDYYDLY